MHQQFDYAGERGQWLDNTVSLQGIVEHLDSLGYTCFIESTTQIFLLSRCWSSAFQGKTVYASVLCVNRDFGAQVDALLAKTSLWDAIVASAEYA